MTTLQATDPAISTISAINHSLYWIRESTRIDLNEQDRAKCMAQATAQAERASIGPFVSGDSLASNFRGWPAFLLREFAALIRFKASTHLRDAVAVAIRVKEENGRI